MASALLGIGGSLLSGLLGGKGAKKAAQAQTQALQQAIAEQRRQYDTTRADFAPYLGTGTAALGQIGTLLGIPMPGVISGIGGGTFNPDGTQVTTGTDGTPVNATELQRMAIEQLKNSPAFTSRYGTGVDTILQNASATGGLRGGNTQNSLANFSSTLLSDVIQQQLGNLGGIANMGMGSAGQLGGFGQQSASNIGNLLSQQGGAQASGIAGQYGAWNNALNGAMGGLQDYGMRKWGW